MNFTIVRMCLAVSVAVSVFASAPALMADQGQTQKTQLIQAIVKAQGMQESLDAQLEGQRKALEVTAMKILPDAAIANCDKQFPEELALLAKFSARLNSLLSGQEMAAAWSTFYGQDLSVSELESILSYYQSPVGQKDVAATKAASPAMGLCSHDPHCSIRPDPGDASYIQWVGRDTERRV
ncbi:DUF2059 domain-containing protein [Uliginosibacterium sp. sgz301328]|uniref:DUF2059 domain-containing protein n=1 Tax=Uliginosibacterium sp. sgz301328 TaxID=3243764 RepID=UPI00359D4DE8